MLFLESDGDYYVRLPVRSSYVILDFAVMFIAEIATLDCYMKANKSLNTFRRGDL